MKPRYLRLLALSVVALCASAPAAFALDANDFAAKLTAAYGQSLPPGSSMKFGAATVAGDAITYEGITVTMAQDTPFKIDTALKFSGVKEQPDGSYMADSLSFPDVDYKFEGGEVSAKDIVLKHLFVANGKTPDITDGSRLFAEASVGPIVVTADGKQVLTIDSASASNSFTPSQSEGPLTAIASSGTTSGLKVNMSQTPDPDSAKQLQELGLSTLTGKAAENMTWALKDGHMTVSEVSLDVDKIGKVKFALDMTGYTPEFLHNLSTLSQSLAQQGTAGNQSQQQTALLLASLQTLFLNSTSLRFDDASITGKVLDMIAKDSSVDKAALIEGLVASIPQQMNEDGSMPQPLVQLIQAATRAYLTDPHSFEVRLAPKTPLGVLGIVAAAMQPAAAADTIGLESVVNDKQITAADAAKETGTAPAAQPAPSTGDDSATAPGDDDSTATPDDNDDDTTATPDDNSDQSASDDGDDDSAGADDRLTSKHAQ